MTGREQQKRETRRRLLETALAVFGQRGILATRMSDIAEAAGVSHGTVFAHFKTQEELVEETIALFGERLCFRAHTLAEGRSGVREVLEAHLKCITEVEPFYTRLVTEAASLPSGARGTLVSLNSAFSFHLSQAAAMEMEKGRILPMPLPLLFNTWMGLVHYYLSNGALFAPEGNVLSRYGEELLSHYLYLIRPKNPKEEER